MHENVLIGDGVEPLLGINLQPHTMIVCDNDVAFCGDNSEVATAWDTNALSAPWTFDSPYLETIDRPMMQLVVVVSCLLVKLKKFLVASQSYSPHVVFLCMSSL